MVKRNISGTMGFLGYEYLGVIGRGDFGTCYKIKKNNRNFVLKIFNANDCKRRKEKLFKEIRILKQLNDHTIPKYYETIDCEGIFGYVMEEKNGVSLEELIDNGYDFSKSEIVGIIFEVIETLKGLHDFDVTHNDIKISNILYSKTKGSTIALIDFGSARIKQNKELDFWGLGDVFLHLLYNSSEITTLWEKNTIETLHLNNSEKRFIKKLLWIEKPYVDLETLKKDFNEIFKKE